MRQFFKFMFASMLGSFLIGIVLIVIFFFAIMGAIAGGISQGVSFGNKKTTVEDGSVLHITLDQEIVDRGDKDHMKLNFGPFQGSSKLGLNQILASLEHAKTDDHIEGVLLDLSFTSAGFSTLREIREKL
ncbi:MAG TPA: hypothetical protein PK760_04185, partial [Flavobacteriales bacterium]|nr:hypothetical protein [Flavobacteriales bacterium]